MKKRVKIAIWFIGAVLIACIAGFINAWIITGGIKMSDLTGDTKKTAEKVIVEDILLTETKDGQKYWEIYGKTGQYVDGKDKVLLQGVIGNFYDEKGEVILSFAGNTGEYEAKNKRVTLTKNAQVASKNQVQMDADKITWEGLGGIVHAEGHIKAIKGDEAMITCDRTVFSTDFKDFHVYGHTKTTVYEKGIKR